MDKHTDSGARPPVPPKDHAGSGATKTRPLARRAHTAPANVSLSEDDNTTTPRPDWILTICYMLIYLELGWLVTLLWRSCGKPLDRGPGLAD